MECLTNAQHTGQSLFVEDYNSAFQMVSKRAVALDLPWFAGFFAGSQYNFVVSGQQNLQDSDAVEVLRVVKYSKDWKRLGSASVYQENCHNPVSFGTMRFAEANGILYIHTCHEMYTAKDGLNHQSNLTLALQDVDWQTEGYNDDPTGYTAIAKYSAVGSEGHKANILREKARYVGIGVMLHEDGSGISVIQLYAK